MLIEMKLGLLHLAECLAFLCADEGDIELSTRLLAAAGEMRKESNQPFSGKDQARYDALLDRLRTDLGPNAFDEAWATGAALTFDAAIELLRSRLA